MYGIVLIFFYYMKRVGDCLSSIFVVYWNWYLKDVFFDKWVSILIDLECCKRIVVYLLGDKLGVGIKLKKIYLGVYIDFLLDWYENVYVC